MISIIHPSRGRPDKSFSTILKWMRFVGQNVKVELIVSLDSDDDEIVNYQGRFLPQNIIINKNRSCVDAINNAAKFATGDILIVVSDDSDCPDDWGVKLIKELDGKSDYLLKTDDGVQDYIVTMTVMDRKYYNRFGYIYHPDFTHQFSDTFMTCVADIHGRLLKSKLKFPHLHYSVVNESRDDLNIRNDLTWKEGQKTFVRLMKQFTPEERARIKDRSMQNFMRQVRI